MKKLFFALSVLTMAFACKKENNPVTLNCKLSMIVTVHSGYTDTTTLSYTGEDYTSVTKYTSGPTVYTRKYTKSGGQYAIEFFTDGVKKYDGFYTLTAQGLFDSSRITNLTTTLFNNRDKNYYGTDGYKTRGISNYNTYENDVKYYYTGEGDYSYWIYDFINISSPPMSTRDSVVFEYYSKNKAAEKFPFESKYGKMEKHLVKKRLYYDLLNAGTLRKTYEYEYLTDEDGLVTREVLVARNQPGNVLSFTDTTYYHYICN